MNLKARFWLLSLALASALALSSCGGGGTTSGGTTGGGATTLNVSALDTLKFEPATLSAPANAQVTVNVKNTGTLQHNWVLVKGGDDVAAKVVEEGTTAGADKGYIPDDTANIVAHSELLNGGASGTVSFTTPAAGTYTYVCTFPGHYAAGMKGTFTTS